MAPVSHGKVWSQGVWSPVSLVGDTDLILGHSLEDKKLERRVFSRDLNADVGSEMSPLFQRFYSTCTFWVAYETGVDTQTQHENSEISMVCSALG
jgi:hypothetical protein